MITVGPTNATGLSGLTGHDKMLISDELSIGMGWMGGATVATEWALV